MQFLNAAGGARLVDINEQIPRADGTTPVLRESAADMPPHLAPDDEFDGVRECVASGELV